MNRIKYTLKFKSFQTKYSNGYKPKITNTPKTLEYPILVHPTWGNTYRRLSRIS